MNWPFFCMPVSPLQKRTTPPPWWACVGPWPPSRAASLWLASSQASAWSTSAQRTVLPSLPARGRQRNHCQPLNRHSDNSTWIQKDYNWWADKCSLSWPVRPFTFTLWALHSLHLHLLSVCERVASVSWTVQQRCRNSCCTAWRPPSVSLSLIVLTWLRLLKCKQLVQVWPLLRHDAWFCAITAMYLYWSQS